MLNVGNVKVPVCHGVTRRSFLAGGRGGPGWADAAGADEPASREGGRRERQAKIKNCITIFLVGSPGHLDTWDMKPDAPAEVRGKFKPISTNVPGIQICEHFPLMARMMDKVALIRSLHHNTGATHENGQRWMMTGHDFNADSVKPHGGSVISPRLRPEERAAGQRRSCPARSATPAPARCTARRPRYLGSAHEPFFLNADPARPTSRSPTSKCPRA